jgi:cytochrome c oxidase subunit III
MDHTAAMHPSESSEFVGTLRGKLAMWLFLISDALTFGCLLAVYGALRMGNAQWPVPGHILNIPLTAFNTFILICSSVTMVKALSAVRHGDQKRLIRFLLGTIAGGAIFLGIQAYEYTHLIHHAEMSLRKDLFSATFFSITGFHGMHVLGGVIYLTIILLQSRRGIYTAQNFERVEIAGLYWHFVDLVWILVFTFVYLI